MSRAAVLAETMAGPRKAAIAIVALGPERAEPILAALPEADVRAVAAEIADLGPVHPDEVRQVLRDLSEGLGGIGVLPAPGKKYAKDLLVRALGRDRGEIVAYDLDTEKPFTWLAEADPKSAAQALASEPPGAVALALAHVEPRAAVKLLTRLPVELREQVAARVAALDVVHPETLEEVEAGLKARLGHVLAVDIHRITGPELLAQMLSFAPVDHERSLLQAVGSRSPELAEAVRNHLFTFDDVTELEPRAMQALLKAVDTKDLAYALSNSDSEIQSRFLNNMSERARGAILEEIDLIAPARTSEVNDAKRKVVARARQLEEEGIIELGRAGEDEDE